MASSRKRPPKPDPADSALLSAVHRAVEQARGAAAATPPPAQGAVPTATPGVLIAFSGGPDSTVLLDLAARLRDAGTPGFAAVHAAHVHHGLQAQADDWARHCTEQCARRGIDCAIRRVRVSAAGRGIEDSARSARYAALLAVAQELGAAIVLTAHHADDRLETFLLQWLRGAGPAGLAGLAGQRTLAGKVTAAGEAGAPAAVQVVRPLLAVSRRELEHYAQRHGLAAVDDPSNADPRFARNALRLHVLPELARIRSGYARSAARSIELVGEAAEVLEELAQEGLQACTEAAPAGMLRLDRLAALAPSRRALVLRAWLAGQGVQAPSRARLAEALDQALNGRADSRMLIRIGKRELRRHGGLLVLRLPGQAARLRERLQWSGETELAVGNWGGVLRFLPAEGPGFDPAWLRERPLELRLRTGGERLKPHAGRPSKRLKHLYQEAGVPEFERSALPLLWRDDRLIFVARVGADTRLLETGPGRVRIEWQGETLLLPE